MTKDLRISIPVDLHRQLKTEAAKRGVWLQELVISILAKSVKG